MPFPFPEALQEFKVETSALSAQYGYHSAAVVNAITKSGTNTLHGSAFEFLRDDSMNARDPFAAIGADGKRRSDGLNRNQFGGSLGGPVVRDQLFFFAAYQRTRVRRIPTSGFQFMPTAGDDGRRLHGIHVACSARAAGRSRLRAPFVNNQVSPTLFSPASVKVVSLLGVTPDNPCGQVFFDRVDNNDEHLFTDEGRLQLQRLALDLRPSAVSEVRLADRLRRNDRVLVQPVGVQEPRLLAGHRRHQAVRQQRRQRVSRHGEPRQLRQRLQPAVRLRRHRRQGDAGHAGLHAAECDRRLQHRSARRAADADADLDLSVRRRLQHRPRRAPVRNRRGTTSTTSTTRRRCWRPAATRPSPARSPVWDSLISCSAARPRFPPARRPACTCRTITSASTRRTAGASRRT